MEKITINSKEEYKVRIASYPRENEFFYESYKQARDELEEIVRETKKYRNNHLINGSGLYNNGYVSDYEHNDIFDNLNDSNDFSNNIIAFSGNRGQGKSSAMLSFSNFLKKRKHIENRKFFSKEIVDSNFIILDRIDPTKFESGEDILTIILAKLFQLFSHIWSYSEKTDTSSRGELLELFQTCYSEIDAIKDKYESKNNYSIYSDLEKLGRIGDSTNLKREFIYLIEKFFKFYCNVTGTNSKIENNFLVIQLDDTDLSTKYAKAIVEDLRKYFMMPNVIIFMAADLVQLTYAIEQGYIVEFKDLQESYKGVRPINYHEIAVKYIDKLIPGRRKILLPRLTAATDEFVHTTTIEYLEVSDNEYENRNILEYYSNNDNLIVDAQELLIRFIYQKTGIVFIKPSNYLHNIVPTNMRELVNFLSVLNNMDDINFEFTDDEMEKENIQLRLKNISLFENYFINNWITNNLSVDYNEIIENYISTPWTLKNKQLICDIKNKFISTLLVPDKTSEDHEVYDSIDFNNEIRELFDTSSSSNYNLSRVRKILVLLENEFPTQHIFKFTFAIKTLYSININKILYNTLLQEYSEEDYNEWTLLTFLGGDIFGDSVEKYIPSQENKLKRAKFDINFENHFDSNKQNEFYESFSDWDNAYLIAMFSNFEFKNSKSESSFKTQYKARNNRTASIIHFDVTYPFMFLIQPDTINYKSVQDISLDFYDDAYYIRDVFMNIISSLDLMHYLDSKLKHYEDKRYNKNEFSDYIVDFYMRVSEAIEEIEYLPLDNDLDFLIEYINENKEFLNYFYKIYKEQDEDSEDNLIEFINRIQLGEEIEELKIHMMTKSFEQLKEYIDDLRDKLEEWENDYNYDLTSYIVDLIFLDDSIEDKSGYMYDEDREIYQKSLNDVIRTLKKDYPPIGVGE